ARQVRAQGAFNAAAGAPRNGGETRRPAPARQAENRDGARGHGEGRPAAPLARRPDAARRPALLSK
ncbi:hypothetical protein CAL29_31285, partial [Bordetella genomosp. 10]